MNEPEKPDFSNSAYLFPKIHPEGFRFGMIALAIVLGIAVLAFFIPFIGALVLPGLVLTYGVLLFFRDPDRYPPDDKTAMLSPADGRVCLIQELPFPEELKDDGQKHWRVSVFMSLFNVHVNRFPYVGQIAEKVYVPGKFVNASLDKASKDNERCAYRVKLVDGREYAVVQIAGLVARRIVPFVKEGDLLPTADRFGLIRFGSRLDIYLPAGVKPEVRIGQIMVAGETILAHLPEVSK